jgi:hypothetical protein
MNKVCIIQWQQSIARVYDLELPADNELFESFGIQMNVRTWLGL